jgi:hypothetical protein
MSNRLNLAGIKFGKWFVIELAPCRGLSKNTYWKVRCECGKEKVVIGTALNCGKSTSCVACIPRNKWTNPGESAKWSLFQQNQINAKRRGLMFTLSLEEFLRITGMPCHYCGRTWSSEHPRPIYSKNSKRPNLVGKLKINGTYKHNGIDRIDSDIGYVSDNCVPCCADCNFAKQRMSQEYFKAWIVRVHSHYIKSSQLAKELVEA